MSAPAKRIEPSDPRWFPLWIVRGIEIALRDVPADERLSFGHAMVEAALKRIDEGEWKP